MSKYLCQYCGETDPSKFSNTSYHKCRECYKKERIEKQDYHCRICGETDPSKFAPALFSRCKECTKKVEEAKPYYCQTCGTTDPANFGSRHTQCKACALKARETQPYYCKICGETDPNQFYSWGHTQCKECYLKVRHKTQIEARERTKQELIDYFGGKCQACGYDRFIECLGLIETDLTKKDGKYNNRVRRETINPSEPNFLKYPSKRMLCHNCITKFQNHIITEDDFKYKYNYVIGEHGIEKKILVENVKDE